MNVKLLGTFVEDRNRRSKRNASIPEFSADPLVKFYLMFGIRKTKATCINKDGINLKSGQTELFKLVGE